MERTVGGIDGGRGRQEGDQNGPVPPTEGQAPSRPAELMSEWKVCRIGLLRVLPFINQSRWH